MAPDNSAHIVDLKSGKVVETVPLRSLATDVGVDPGSRYLVTAQCGGVGNDCDTTLGYYDTSDGGEVRYLESTEPNPLGAVMIAPGKVLIANGCVTPEGVAVSILSVPGGDVLASGGVPDMALDPFLAGGRIWAYCISEKSGAHWRVLDPETLQSTVLISGETAPASIVGDPLDPHRLFGLFQTGEAKAVTVSPIDPDTGVRLGDAGPSVEFMDGPGASAMVGDTLAIADYTGADLQRYGTQLLLLRPGVSDEVRVIDIPGGAASLAVWEDSILVLEGATGRVLALDVESGAITEIAVIEGVPGFFLDIEVLP